MSPPCLLRELAFLSTLSLAVTIAGCGDSSSVVRASTPAGGTAGAGGGGGGAAQGGSVASGGEGGLSGKSGQAGVAGQGGAAAGVGGAGGAASELARLTAPEGEGFGEAVIAAAGSELLVAYTRLNEAREVQVEVQRFSRAKASLGAALGAPMLLHTYALTAGQLAYLSGGFHGNLSLATDGDRYMLCWGEQWARGCAAIPVGEGPATVASVVLNEGELAHPSQVVHGSAGWFAFTTSSAPVGYAPVALELGLDASLQKIHPLELPLQVDRLLVTPTPSGFAVVAIAPGLKAYLVRFGPDLTPSGQPLALGTRITWLASSGEVVSAVGPEAVVTIDALDQVTTMPLGGQGLFRNIVASGNGAFGVTWSSLDQSLFCTVDAAQQVSEIRQVGQSPKELSFLTPSAAFTDEGFFFASPHPDGQFEVFYNAVFPTLRVTHLAP